MAPRAAIPLARLSFGYGPFVVGPNERRTTMARGGKLYRLVRQRDAEEHLAQRLGSLGFERVSRIVPSWYANPWADDLMLPGDPDGSAWLHVLLHDLPRCARKAGRSRSPTTSRSASPSRTATCPPRWRKAPASTGWSCISA